MKLLEGLKEGVLIQGLSSSLGRYCLREMVLYGTKVLGAVEPGRGGTEWEGIPVFDTVREAQGRTGARISVVSVMGSGLIDSLIEAADAGIGLIICISGGEKLPRLLWATRVVEQYGSLMLGPSCGGILIPNLTKVGILPHYGVKGGRWIVVSRSASLAHTIVTSMGLGISVWIDVGEEILGRGIYEILKELRGGGESHGVLYLAAGDEVDLELGEFLKGTFSPSFAYIPGREIDPGRYWEISSALRGKGFFVLGPDLKIPQGLMPDQTLEGSSRAST